MRPDRPCRTNQPHHGHRTIAAQLIAKLGVAQALRTAIRWSEDDARYGIVAQLIEQELGKPDPILRELARGGAA